MPEICELLGQVGGLLTLLELHCEARFPLRIVDSFESRHPTLAMTFPGRVVSLDLELPLTRKRDLSKMFWSVPSAKPAIPATGSEISNFAASLNFFLAVLVCYPLPSCGAIRGTVSS